MFKKNIKLLRHIIPTVKVFARVSPKQKEYVVTMLKSLGFYTLMCGDGTNDVGALKHADVGVALLSNTQSELNTAEYEMKRRAKITEAQQLSKEVSLANLRNRNVAQTGRQSAQTGAFVNPHQQAITNAQKKLADVLKELEEADQAQIVKLGDASIASPFTYKQSSIQCGTLY